MSVETRVVYFFKVYKLFISLNLNIEVFMSAFKHLRMCAAHMYLRLTDALYVPSRTGSYGVGDQYLGDLASAYVENNNFPDAARVPFKGIQIHQALVTKS